MQEDNVNAMPLSSFAVMACQVKRNINLTIILFSFLLVQINKTSLKITQPLLADLFVNKKSNHQKQIMVVPRGSCWLPTFLKLVATKKKR